ncbi:MAG: transposase [Ornithinibacter sp.]
MSIAPEVVLFTGYACALLLIACALDRVARHSHARSDRYRTAGFRYHPQHDAWVCPQDQMLWPTQYDEKLRLMRYRAKPSVCNACPVKHSCTSSPHGREITRETEPWPHSEAARFHRGLVLVLIGLAGLLLMLMVVRHHQPADLAVVVGPLAGCGLLAHRFTDHFRRTPSGFPAATSSTGLRITQPSRTGWASDRRKDAL